MKPGTAEEKPHGAGKLLAMPGRKKSPIESPPAIIVADVDELVDPIADEAPPLPCCPRCDCTHAPEISAKFVKLGSIRKRRSQRQCRNCGSRFAVTTDAPEDP